MRHLLSDLEKIKIKLRGRLIFFFLDFDGTLSPIARTPAQAKIPAQAKSVLKALAATKRFKVAIVSGRAMDDIQKLVGLKNLIYAANHGLEIRGPKLKLSVALPQGYSAALKKIKRVLIRDTAGIKGIVLEDKGVGLALHYRLAANKDLALIKNIFNRAVRAYVSDGLVRVSYSKKAFEAGPRINWDKGLAVLWLLRRFKSAVPVYIGDDTTDEDAFRRLKFTGLTAVVGKARRSKAQYYLEDTKEVTGFLKKIWQNC